MVAGLLAFTLTANVLQGSELKTVHIPALEIRTVAEQVATRTNRNLRVADSLGSLPIVINAERIDSKVLLDSIALATHTEWKQEGDSLVLVRPTYLNNRLRDSDFAMRTEAIRTSIDQLPDSGLLTDTPYNLASRIWKLIDEYIHRRANTQEVRNDIITFRTSNLARELLLGFIKSVDPAWFVTLPFNTPIVFSDHPTVAQRKLPDLVGTLTERYVAAETALYGIASQDLDPELAKDFFVRNTLATLGPEQRINRVIVTFRWVRNEIRCSLATFTKSGVLKAVDSIAIPLRLESSGRLDDINLSGAEVHLSSHSQKYEELIKKPNQSSAAALFSVRDATTKFDLLQFAVSDSLKKLSTHLGKPVIACLSDEIGPRTSQLVKEGTLSLSGFVSNLMRDHEMIIGKEAIIVRPSCFLEADRIRLPRSAIRSAIQKSISGKEFDVRSQSVFSFDSANGTTSPLYEPMLNLLSHTSGKPRQMLYTSTWVQKILGSLSDVEWKQLVERRSLDIIAKRPIASALVLAWTSDPILPCAYISESGGTRRDVLLNGSESWPAVHATQPLRVRVGEEPLIKSLQGDGSYFSTYPTSFVPVSEFWKAFESAKIEGESALSQFRNRSFEIAYRRTVIVEFQPTEGVIKSEILADFQLKRQPNSVKFSDIPPSSD